MKAKDLRQLLDSAAKVAPQLSVSDVAVLRVLARLFDANDDAAVKIVGMMFGKSSVAVLYAKEAGISKPADLLGKRIARAAAGASANMFPAFLKANNIDRAGIKEVVANSSSFFPLLMSKQVDAVLDQSSYLGRYRDGAKGAGLTIEAFRFADFGLDLYGDAILVEKGMIEKNPDLIRRFIAATLKGNAYAFDNPDEAIAILRKTNSELVAPIAKEELLDTKELALTSEVAQHGLGYIDANHMERTQAVVSGALGLKRHVPLNEIYTLDLLPKR